MTDMIERVARALHRQYGGFKTDDEAARDWAIMERSDPPFWRDMARAAILAMREPTEAMCAEHSDYVSPEFSEHVRQGWRAMIDAALREP